MALFNRRKQNTDVLPEEVREYYQSEKRERTGAAWLLALGTLLVTFFIAAGLFFSGRWVYRTVFNHDDSTNKTTASSQDSGLRIDEKGNVVGDGQLQPATTSEQGSTNTAPTNSSATTPTTKPTVTPNTGPSQLVDTGPGNDE